MAYDSSLNHEDASNLSDQMMSKDGKVLGGLLSLPEPVAVALNAFRPWLVGKLTEFGQEPATQAFTTAARALKVKNAEVVGAKLGKGTALLMPYTFNIVDVVGTAREHVKQKKELLSSLEPLLSANRDAHKGDGATAAISSLFASGYADNKMVQHALDVIRKDTYSNLSVNALNVVPSMVNNYGTNIENKLQDERVKFRDEPSEAGGKRIEELEKKSKNVDVLNMGSGGLTAAISTYMSKKAEANRPDTSLSKVIDLQSFIKDEAIDGPGAASTQAVLAVADRVEDIFQTYQKEQGHHHIPMHRMREVSKQIAEEMIAGDLHALSLVNIVGNEKLLTGKKDDIVSTDKVAEVLKKEVEIFSKNSAITSEEFLKDRPFTLDDVKAHLDTKNMDEKALLVAMVPEATLLEAGAKKDEIKAMRSHLSHKVQEGVYSAVVGALAQQTDDQLAEKGFGREGILFIREHDAREEGAETVAHAMQTRATAEAVKDVVLTELMGESSQKWQNYIASVKEQAVAHVKGAGHAKQHKPLAASHAARLDGEQVSTTERQI